jgi:hypothetical protein
MRLSRGDRHCYCWPVKARSFDLILINDRLAKTIRMNWLTGNVAA